MALQTSIVEYFNLRKRGADSVDLKKDASHRVLILDKNSVTGGDSVASGRAGKIKTGDVDTSPVPRVIVYAESPSSSVKKTAGSALRRRKTPLTGRRSSKDKQSNKFPDIRKCLFGGNVNSETKYETPNQASQEPERVNVPFRIHSLSPSKQLKTRAREPRTPVKEEPTVGEPKTPVKEEHSVGEPKTPVKEEHSVGEPKTPVKEEPSVGEPKTPVKEEPSVGEPSLSAAPVTPPTISCPEPPTTAVPVTPPKKETHPSNEPGPSGINDEELIRAPKKARKFAELKHRLHKFNEGVSRLKDLQERNQKLPPLSPKIKEFKTIELEVDSSPTKKIDVVPEAKSTRSPSLLKRSLFMSPKKGSQGSSFMSPRKLFDTPPPKSPSKPAYQEYYDLAIAGKPALPLPYKYKVLAETFRSVDTVVSMMFNRNEAATFTKVKASAQQLSKRNLTEEHIGQILTVMPTAYELRREKIRVLGGQRDQYELVLKPVIPEGSYDVKDIEERGKMSMTPSMTLERRRNFYTALIEKVKDQHEVFLRGLNPPLVIPREELMRWHPDFNVDGSCPDITPAALPSAPVQEKLSTARDVLNKAKDMLSCNNRMGKALERLSGAPAPSPPSDTAIATAALTKALKGIPKALLEKVRAKQAAKTAALLTRCPEETKRRLELTRLPELTRILRNIYVLERKNVIPLPVVLQKLSQSFRENLSQDDLKRHISMIMEAVPGWIAEIADGDKKYLRLSRDADFSRVTNKLQTLIDTNRVGF